jgi:hypothetical protein
MTKATAALLALPALAALAWAASATRSLRSEVQELKDRLARIEARPRTEPAAQVAKEVDALRTELARVEAKATSAAASPAPAAPAASVTPDELRKLIDERLEERKTPPDAPAANSGGDRKMPLHDLAKELAIDPETQRRVAEIANRTKKEIFDVLKTPRPDGSEMAGDLIQAFLSGDAGRTRQVFQRLFVEKIPGTEQTYLSAVAGIQDRARQTLRGTMGDAIYTRFEHMSVQPENIETGWDPWGDYVKERGLTPSK